LSTRYFYLAAGTV